MYPSIITSFTYPTSSDRLNNPSHSALENLQSSTIGQIQAVLGQQGGANASTLGTIIGDLRNPASDGGGHVQTASKGGTGQTTYTKGDLLVAQSSSVLTKLAVSSTVGDILVADTTQAVGMKWATNPNSNKVVINTSSIIVSGTTLQPIFSASILGSTLGINNAIKFRGEIRRFGSQNDFSLRMDYGVNSIVSLTITNTQNSSALSGFVEGAIMPLGNSSVQQFGYININLLGNGINTTGPQMHLFSSGISSVNSQANQDLVISANYQGTNALSSMTAGTFIVEKIS